MSTFVVVSKELMTHPNKYLWSEDQLTDFNNNNKKKVTTKWSLYLNAEFNDW